MPSSIPGRKISPLVWILGGVVLALFGTMLTCGIMGFLAGRAIKNAGYDAGLMKKNPGLAMARMAAVQYPDFDVVSTDDRKGRITLRQKSTGKVVIFRFDPDQQTLVIAGDDRYAKSNSSSGSGLVTLKSNESTVTIGSSGSNKPPAWVPVYPGSTAENAFSAKTPQGTQSAFTLKTKDALSKVMDYYQDAFKTAGLAVTQTMTNDNNGLVRAESNDQKRTAVISVASTSAETQVSVTVVEKQ